MPGDAGEFVDGSDLAMIWAVKRFVRRPRPVMPATKNRAKTVDFVAPPEFDQPLRTSRSCPSRASASCRQQAVFDPDVVAASGEFARQ
jgi:hypothetical protein